MTTRTTFSTYLDLLRFTAALFVVLEHAALLGLLPHLGIATELSHESVISFFVLSGLVIAASSWSRQTTARAYIVARSSRILPVALPAIVCCFAVAAFRPGGSGIPPGTLAARFVSSAFFMNGVWTNYVDVPFNGPYWSLCCEVWYYACWGVLRFATRVRTRVAAAAFLLLAMGPAFAALFGVWLMGAFIASERPSLARLRRMPRWLMVTLFASSAIGVAVIAGTDLQEFVRGLLRLRVHAWWRMRSAEYVATDYLIGALVAVHLAVAAWLFGDSRRFTDSRIGQFAARCAGFTFTLYLFHYPMLLVFRAMRGPEPPSMAAGLTAIAAALAGAWIVSLATERQLPRWRRIAAAAAERVVALAAFASHAIDRRAIETLAVRLLIVAGGFVSSILTARWLSPAGRGEYFLVVTLAQMFAQFGTFGLQSSNTYFAAQPGGSRAGALLANSIWVSLVVGGGGSAVAILAMTFTGSTPPARLWLAAVLAPATLFYMLGTNLLVGLKQIATYNWFQLASNYGVLLCLAAAALLGAGSTGFAAASATGWVVVATLLVYVCRRGRRESLRFSVPVFRDGTRYALKAYLATLCGYLILRSNVFLLNAVQGSAEVGQFSIASQISDVVGILPQSVALVLFPTLIGASSDRFKTMARNLVTSGGLLAIGCTLLALIAEPFIRIVFGVKFAESAAVLRWMLPGAFFLGLTSIASQYLAAGGFPPALCGVWIAGLVVAAAAGRIFIPAAGAVGAAIALTAAHAAVFAGVFGLCLFYAKRELAVAPLVFASPARQGAPS